MRQSKYINLQNETIIFESMNFQIDVLEVDNNLTKVYQTTRQNNPASLDDGTPPTAKILQSIKLTAGTCKRTKNRSKTPNLCAQ